MVERKKPTGKEWIELESRYHSSKHEEKLDLARKHGVTYDTLKHWVAEKDTTPLLVEEVPEDAIIIDLEEFFENEPAVKLDFCSFDLETTNLTADFSVMLCACLKPFGETPVVFRADDYNPNWATQRMDDKELTKAIATELAKHAIIVTHYGSGFDIPYLRAKMVYHRLPPLPPMFGIDTYRIAKANFRVSSRRLKNLCRYFELGQKSEVEGGLWMKAGMDGDIDALDAIVAHNIQDVLLLEKLAALSFPYLKGIRKL